MIDKLEEEIKSIVSEMVSKNFRMLTYEQGYLRGLERVLSEIDYLRKHYKQTDKLDK
jgi:hypothetical protein